MAEETTGESTTEESTTDGETTEESTTDGETTRTPPEDVNFDFDSSDSASDSPTTTRVTDEEAEAWVDEDDEDDATSARVDDPDPDPEPEREATKAIPPRGETKSASPGRVRTVLAVLEDPSPSSTNDRVASVAVTSSPTSESESASPPSAVHYWDGSEFGVWGGSGGSYAGTDLLDVRALEASVDGAVTNFREWVGTDAPPRGGRLGAPVATRGGGGVARAVPVGRDVRERDGEEGLPERGGGWGVPGVAGHANP